MWWYFPNDNRSSVDLALQYYIPIMTPHASMMVVGQDTNTSFFQGDIDINKVAVILPLGPGKALHCRQLYRLYRRALGEGGMSAVSGLCP